MSAPENNSDQASVPTMVPAQAVIARPSYEEIPRTSNQSTMLGIERYFTFLRRRWWLLLVSLTICVGLAAAYIRWWPVSYVSTARMWVAGKTKLREGAVYDEQTQNYAGTQAELLQSTKIQQLAVTRVKEVRHITIPTDPEGRPLLIKLRVTPVQRSAILELKAQGPAEEYVRAFLDATMEVFLVYKGELRSTSVGDTYSSVSQQLKRQEIELKAEQEKLAAYQRENNVAVLEEQAKAAGIYLSKLLTELSELKLEYQLLNAGVPQKPGGLPSITNTISGDPEPNRITTPGTAPGSTVEGSLGAQQELERLKITRERLSKYLRPKHPKIIKLDEEISRSEKLIDYLVRQSQEQLVKAKEGTKLKMETIQQNIKEWEAKVSSASERLAESQRLKVNVDRMRAFYEHLLGLLQNVEVSRNLEQEAITILDPASPTKDKKLPAVAVLPAGVVLGLLAGLALVFLVERWDDSVTSLEDARGRFDEWIVGQVPEAPKPRKKGRLALLERNDERDILGESFRNLRSALLFGPTAEMKPKVILVTSAIPHEGKSMVAANLARTIAFSGARVLLVDGDMRCGVLHEIFEVPCMPGLSELLTDGAEASSVIRPTSVPNLFILPCGTVAEGSGELFLGPVFDRFLTKVRQEYDFVVMDSVPVFAADDTTTLAPKMDGVLFVVRRSFTSARTTQRALELLYERQAQVLGLVFNRANTKQHSYYYYKYHKYYGQSKKAKRK